MECVNVAGVPVYCGQLASKFLHPPSCTLDTPLGIACGRGGKPELILLLVKGGAHLYFRGKDSLTPMHRAAIGGNTEAIKTLLGLGASPNYRDAKVRWHVVTVTDQTLPPWLIGHTHTQ